MYTIFEDVRVNVKCIQFSNNNFKYIEIYFAQNCFTNVMIKYAALKLRIVILHHFVLYIM